MTDKDFHKLIGEMLESYAVMSGFVIDCANACPPTPKRYRREWEYANQQALKAMTGCRGIVELVEMELKARDRHWRKQEADMTDRVHPVVEAMARAIAEACGEPQAWVAHIEPAKAAAKVLLSAPPNGHMIQAAVQTLHDDLEPTDQELAEIYTAMTAAARSDMGV